MDYSKGSARYPASPTNEDRLHSAREALLAHSTAQGDDPANDDTAGKLADLLTNLRHLAVEADIDIEERWDVSRDMFDDEQED